MEAPRCPNCRTRMRLRTASEVVRAIRKMPREEREEARLTIEHWDCWGCGRCGRVGMAVELETGKVSGPWIQPTKREQRRQQRLEAKRARGDTTRS